MFRQSFLWIVAIVQADLVQQIRNHIGIAAPAELAAQTTESHRCDLSTFRDPANRIQCAVALKPLRDFTGATSVTSALNTALSRSFQQFKAKKLVHDQLDKTNVKSMERIQAAIDSNNALNMSWIALKELSCCAVDDSQDTFFMHAVRLGLAGTVRHPISHIFGGISGIGGRVHELKAPGNDNLLHLAATSHSDEVLEYLLGSVHASDVIQMLEQVNDRQERPVDIAKRTNFLSGVSKMHDAFSTQKDYDTEKSLAGSVPGAAAPQGGNSDVRLHAVSENSEPLLSKPSLPDEPSTPLEPSLPDEPSTPDEPSIPDEPSTPREPSLPEEQAADEIEPMEDEDDEGDDASEEAKGGQPELGEPEEDVDENN